MLLSLVGGILLQALHLTEMNKRRGGIKKKAKESVNGSRENFFKFLGGCRERRSFLGLVLIKTFFCRLRKSHDVINNLNL